MLIGAKFISLYLTWRVGRLFSTKNLKFNLKKFDIFSTFKFLMLLLLHTT